MGYYLEGIEADGVLALYADDIVASLKVKYPEIVVTDIEIKQGVSYGGLLFHLYRRDDLISLFSIVAMPGCCGMAISTGSYVYDKYRRLGIGTLLNRIRIALAKEMGYGILMCTDVLHNEPQQNILTNNGWIKVFEFDNPRTGNGIGIHVVNL